VRGWPALQRDGATPVARAQSTMRACRRGGCCRRDRRVCRRGGCRRDRPDVPALRLGRAAMAVRPVSRGDRVDGRAAMAVSPMSALAWRGRTGRRGVLRGQTSWRTPTPMFHVKRFVASTVVVGRDRRMFRVKRFGGVRVVVVPALLAATTSVDRAQTSDRLPASSTRHEPSRPCPSSATFKRSGSTKPHLHPVVEPRRDRRPRSGHCVRAAGPPHATTSTRPPEPFHVKRSTCGMRFRLCCRTVRMPCRSALARRHGSPQWIPVRVRCRMTRNVGDRPWPGGTPAPGDTGSRVPPHAPDMRGSALGPSIGLAPFDSGSGVLPDGSDRPWVGGDGRVCFT
jgi:hypothetical protein